MDTENFVYKEKKNLDEKVFTYLIFFCMIYATIILFNIILTNRYVKLWGDFFVLGGTLTSPLFFILGDIIAELFGYKISRKIIWAGFICQFIFTLLVKIIVNSPYPPVFKNYFAYFLIFNPLFFLVIDSFVAFIIAGLTNAYVLTKWKKLLKGRYFWLRSIGSSFAAEALYSIIAIVMMEIKLISTHEIIKIIFVSFLIKIIYSTVFAGPANVLVNFIKDTAKIDVYDDPVIFNPLKKLSEKIKRNKIF